MSCYKKKFILSSNIRITCYIHIQKKLHLTLHDIKTPLKHYISTSKHTIYRTHSPLRQRNILLICSQAKCLYTYLILVCIFIHHPTFHKQKQTTKIIIIICIQLSPARSNRWSVPLTQLNSVATMFDISFKFSLAGGRSFPGSIGNNMPLTQ